MNDTRVYRLGSRVNAINLCRVSVMFMAATARLRGFQRLVIIDVGLRSLRLIS